MKKKLISLTVLLITLSVMFAVQAREIPADEKVKLDYTCSGPAVDCWVIVVD